MGKNVDGAGGREDRRRVRAALLVLGVSFLTVGTLVTSAVFTDSEVVGGNAFTTGSIDLTTAPASAIVSFSGMAPGDQVTDDVVVGNSGSLQLRYAISASATNADGKGLKDQLVLTIRTIDNSTPASPCNDFDGTQLYTGDLDDGVTGRLVGDNTQGAQAGDRTLNAAASETLCFRVALPLSTGGAYMNASTTATFTFDAEQTANN